MVSDWFDRVLPALLVQRFDDFLAVRGDIGFRVGDERWTLCFGDVERPVRRGGSRGTVLELRFSERAFEAFIAGTLDIPAARAGGELSAVGEVTLLQTLATFMSPVQRDNLGWSTS